MLESTPYAARLGLRTAEVTGDAVTASVPYSGVLANAQGFVHGGVAASLSVWSAMIMAVASDRDAFASARPLSLSISYLAAAREEALHAAARVTSRGRDIAHVEIEVSSDRGRPVGLALAVMRMLPDAPRRHVHAPAAAAGAGPDPLLISPFTRAMGVAVRAHHAGSVTMTMGHDANEGLDGAADAGALVALADTCAALACLPSLDERVRGSATLSLSAVFGEALRTAAMAVGRPVAEDGAIRSALVEVGADDARGASHMVRHHAMTACVSYRFLSATGNAS